MWLQNWVNLSQHLVPGDACNGNGSKQILVSLKGGGDQ